MTMYSCGMHVCPKQGQIYPYFGSMYGLYRYSDLSGSGGVSGLKHRGECARIPGSLKRAQEGRMLAMSHGHSGRMSFPWNFP